MKKFLKAVKQQDGFTLIELMVVVAIIGLLSAVAIPNFKKYQAKSKVTEAKLQLSAIYIAETAFFSDYNMYAGCLKYMGYDPANESASRYYTTGFDAPAAVSGPAAVSANNSGMSVDATLGCMSIAGANIAQAMFAAGKGIGGVVTATVTGNAAGTGTAASCAASASTTGSCVGTQADNTNMEWQAAAVGFISGDYLTIATASGLNINEKKIISTVVQGY